MRPTVLLCLLGFVGCMGSDPAPNPDTASGQTVRPKVERGQTAPLNVDPAILKNRTFGEAPMLAEKVRRGDLPPVSERLSENPLVVIPIEEIGTYGGTLRRALTGDVVQTVGVNKTLSESLMGYERPLPKSIQPNLAESHTFQDSGKTALFEIRKGIKWSDGVPFTVDDILFYYEDMIWDENARWFALPPSVWMADDKPIRFEKIDDHTLKISSSKPLGRVLNALSGDNVAYPKHILSRLHPRYNPKATYETFRDSTTNAQRILKPNLPRLTAWVPVEWIRGQRIVYERNPYYWKIDTAGNQLPYADYIEFNVIPDHQVILLKFINGEIDLFGRYGQANMYSTLKAEERKGKFHLRLTQPENGPGFYLNWDTPKPHLREAFRDRRVRIALSHALNREEINQILYHGLLEPSGFSFTRGSPYFSEEAYRKYTAYDPGKARRLLDEAGYTDGDDDGYRELKNGDRFELTIDVTPGFDVDISELVAEQWAAVGIKTSLNIALRDIVWPRRLSGEFDVHYWILDGLADPLSRLNDFTSINPNRPFWHRTASEEGPEWLRKATRLLQKALTTVDSVQLRTHMTRARDLYTENIPIIVIGSPYQLWGASTRLGNVPYEITKATERRGWGRPVFHEQIFIRQDPER